MGENLWSDPIVQYGFAGMCAVLLLIITWLARRLLELLEKNVVVIAANTSAIERLAHDYEKGEQVYSDLRDRLLSRPCLALRREPTNIIKGKGKTDV